MSPAASLGRLLIVAGLVLAAAGGLMLLLGRLPRLPGDIVVQRPNVTVYLPIGTMLVVSVLVTLFLSLLSRR